MECVVTFPWMGWQTSVVYAPTAGDAVDPVSSATLGRPTSLRYGGLSSRSSARQGSLSGQTRELLTPPEGYA